MLFKARSPCPLKGFLLSGYLTLWEPPGVGSTSFNAKKARTIARIYPFGHAGWKEAAVCVRRTVYSIKGPETPVLMWGHREDRPREAKGTSTARALHTTLSGLSPHPPSTRRPSPGPGREGEAGVAHGLRQRATPGTPARGPGRGSGRGPRHWVLGTPGNRGGCRPAGADRGRAGRLGLGVSPGAQSLGALRSEASRPRGLLRPARPGAHSSAKAPRAARSRRGGCKGGGGAFAPGPPAPPIR